MPPFYTALHTSNPNRFSPYYKHFFCLILSFSFLFWALGLPDWLLLTREWKEEDALIVNCISFMIIILFAFWNCLHEFSKPWVSSLWFVFTPVDKRKNAEISVPIWITTYWRTVNENVRSFFLMNRAWKGERANASVNVQTGESTRTQTYKKKEYTRSTTIHWFRFGLLCRHSHGEYWVDLAGSADRTWQQCCRKIFAHFG